MTFNGRFIRRKAFNQTGKLGKRRRPVRVMLAGASLFLLGLIAGIYLFFPAESLQQRIIQEIKARTDSDVQIEQVSLYPPLSLYFSQVKIAKSGLPMPLQIEQLRLAPQWSTVLSSDPGMQLQAQLMNGDVTAEILKGGKINVTATGLHFDLPLQIPMTMKVTGNLDRATAVAATRLDPETNTQLTLQLSDVVISNLDFFKEGNPGITLGEIFMEINGQGRAMKINTLTLKGGDFNINGEGTLFIARTYATSRINLSLHIKVTDSAQPILVSLLELTAPPDTNGNHHLRVSGTLAAPTIAPIK